MRPALLFDLDGTLVDSALDLHDALVALLDAHGRPPVTPEAARRMIGHGARVLIGRAWAATGAPADADELEALYPEFLALYAPRATRRTQPYPEVRETLEALADHPLAVVTNKPEGPARAVLDGLDLARFFGAVVGGDTLPVKKPDPAPLELALDRLKHEGQAVFVGDSGVDVAAARAAGLPVVAVRWGYPHEPVDELGADAVADRFGDLPRLVDDLLSRLR